MPPSTFCQFLLRESGLTVNSGTLYGKQKDLNSLSTIIISLFHDHHNPVGGAVLQQPAGFAINLGILSGIPGNVDVFAQPSPGSARLGYLCCLVDVYAFLVGGVIVVAE